MSLMQRPDTMQARLAEAEARIERLEQENARLREAGRKAVNFLRGDDVAGGLDACRVFEEGR